MTAPALAAERFALACLLGLPLGALYGFLRPLRPRRGTLADLLFVAAAAAAWLYLSFGICQGDLRLGYSAGLAAGGFCWEWTAGQLLRPVFSMFWQTIGRFWALLTLPAKKISHFLKILFASVKKWVTIKWRNRRQKRRTSGGAPNGTDQELFQSHQAGPSAQQQPEQDRGDRHHRIVYGGAVHPASGYEQN
ncbi:MAG: hypothetical protein IJ375_05080 [Oscillospiraceae bacterium]|nr:hypothetical protein [Oscillospiraceae bacterium]